MSRILCAKWRKICKQIAYKAVRCDLISGSVNREGIKMPEDMEIYSLIMEHPEKGIEVIMNSYTAFVYTIVHGKLHGICKKQDIEECVSDVFYEIYRTRYNICLEKGSIKAYLAVIAKRKAIDVFRKHRKNTEDMSIDEGIFDWITSDEDVEKLVFTNEVNDILIDVIKALGEPDSQIIIHKYYFGQSTKIISKLLGIKENTIDKKVSRALTKLRNALGGVLL